MKKTVRFLVTTAIALLLATSAAMAQASEEAKAIFAGAESKFAKGDYPAAIAEYTRALELDPKFAEAYVSRGEAKSVTGDREGAIADYTKVIELDPKSADAYNNRASCYLIQGNREPGCRDAQKVCDLGNCRTLETAKGKGLCR